MVKLYILAVFAFVLLVSNCSAKEKELERIKRIPFKQPHFQEDIKPTVVNPNIVEEINSKKTTWTASLDQGFVSKLTLQQAKGLCGALKGGIKLQKKTYKNLKLNVPETFDSRENWPQCATMKVIRDQSACGSCWAFASVEAMSDRICVFKKQNVSISAQDMNSCCDSCGYGCDGGYPSEAWNYWVNTGVVTSKCDPYSLPGCDHHIPNSKNPCPSQEYPTPPCVQACKDGEVWSKAKHFGSSAYSVSGEDDIKAEIFQNGPVGTAFTVYEDFLSYKSGVYQHVSGQAVGGHAVKFIGWGTENGVKYWLVANSWNADWGMDGYFKIIRGQDECGIEDEADCGIPA